MPCNQNLSSSCCANQSTSCASRVRFCNAPSNLTQQLYSCIPSDILVDACYDNCGCSIHPRAARCPFWPNFARPRWLCCNQLYSRSLNLSGCNCANNFAGTRSAAGNSCGCGSCTGTRGGSAGSCGCA